MKTTVIIETTKDYMHNNSMKTKQEVYVCIIGDELAN